jgi:F-type H+-transporting ATPase subunit delta
MSLRTSANRYAKALFDVALQEKADTAKIEQDLAAVAELFASNVEVLHVARRAGLPDAARQSLISTVADRLGVSPQVKKLLLMLTERRGLEMVPVLLEAYRERLLDHLNIVRGEVTSATPLTPEKTQALQERLSKATGKNVELSVRVDPELIGGVVARIGSTVYDGSVRTQLKRLRQELTESREPIADS